MPLLFWKIISPESVEADEEAFKIKSFPSPTVKFPCDTDNPPVPLTSTIPAPPEACKYKVDCVVPFDLAIISLESISI